MNGSHLIIRNLPDDVATALEREMRRRGTSLNQTVIDLLRQSLGLKLLLAAMGLVIWLERGTKQSTGNF